MREQSDRPNKAGGWIHRLTPERSNGHAPRATSNGRRGSVPGRTTRYEIRGTDGVVVAIKVRKEIVKDGQPDKDMWLELPNGTRGLKTAGLTSAGLPLYGVEALAGAPAGAAVIVCEGEKAADALRSLGVLAVGTVTGAQTIPDPGVLAALVGYDVCLWPDNDDPGRSHMAGIARWLVGLHVTPRLLEWADAPPKGDAADFVAAGLGKAQLNAMHDAAALVEEANGHVAAVAGLVEWRLSDLTPEVVHWLWPKRIPLAKMTVLDGDPGLGKSTVTLDLAARVTLGKVMPDGAWGDLADPGGVLLLTAEDGLRDTVLPRLKALGANLDLVFALESVPNDKGESVMPAIPRDLAIIEQRIVEHNVKLIVIDPLIAFLGDSSETNTWRDQDIRRALGPFAQMLERTGCAAVFVRHLNKGSGGNPIYRGGGSIGIIGAVRSGLLVSKDPDDESGLRRILVPTKANLSAPAKGMAYHMEQAENGSVLVVWDGETEHTAVGLLAEPLSEEDRDQLNSAVEFLRGELYGNPIETKEIERRAREAGLSIRTLQRARRKLGVISKKTPPYGRWTLELPVRFGPKAEAVT